MRTATAYVESALESLISHFWEDGDFVSEDTLRPKVRAAIALFQDALRKLNWQQAANVVHLYQSVADRCTTEPLATPYDMGRMLLMAYAADAHAGCGSYDRAYELVGDIKAILELTDARRQREDVLYRPNSEIRMLRLLVMAKCKWQGPLNEDSKVRTPLQIITEFYKVAERMYGYLERNPPEDSIRDGQSRELIALTNVEIAKMAFRYCPDQVRRLVEFFNEHNPDRIEAEVQHYGTAQPWPSDRYWDFELAKLDMSGRLTPSSFAHCYTLRRKYMDQTIADTRDLSSRLFKWQSEGEKMLRRIPAKRRSLEVLGG